MSVIRKRNRNVTVFVKQTSENCTNQVRIELDASYYKQRVVESVVFPTKVASKQTNGLIKRRFLIRVIEAFSSRNLAIPLFPSVRSLVFE